MDQDFREDILQRLTICEEKIRQLQCSEQRKALQREIEDIKADLDLHDQRIYDLKDQMPNKQTWALITGILVAIVGVVAGVLL